ncbi:MAG TPA: hypothetical protein VFD97_03440 [Acidimicrobiia bacterium]|nr:hypothetical protein [Acidimicrobiia bacterium]
MIIRYLLAVVLIPIGVVVLAPLGVGIPIFAVGMALLLPNL